MRKNNYVWLLPILISSFAFAADTTPAKKKKKITLNDFLNNTMGAPESPSVAGVRGLEDTSGPVDTKVRDYAAIQRLESVVVDQEAVKKFVEEGKLK